MRGITPEFVDMSKEILYPKFRVLQRRARILRPTVGPADCWLTGQSGAPPDSPVIYSRTPLIASQEQPVDSRRPGAPDTVRCTTGQSGAPRPSCLWLNRAISFPT
jgi:hypothetical protein